MTFQPLVSICIPAYNAENYLADTLRCLLNQSYANIEIIIVDDSSIDKTHSIAKTFSSLDNRVKVFQKPNGGAAAARNYAFNKSKGDFIKFFDADDLVNRDGIEKQVYLLKANINGIVSGKWARFYNNDLTTATFSPEAVWKSTNGTEWIIKSWQNGQSMTQPGIFLLPRTLIENAGLWDEELTLIDDLEFFTKMILNSSGVFFCEDSILYYRSGLIGSLSNNLSRKALESAYRSIDKGVDYLKNAENTTLSRNSSAALFQSLAYISYISYPEIYKKAKVKVVELGGSRLPYPAGGLTKILIKIIGWKLTCRIKSIIKLQ